MSHLRFAAIAAITMFVVSCGGGGGGDVLDSHEPDVQGDVMDVIQDVPVQDIRDVREDAEVTQADVVDAIEDAREDEIGGTDVPAEIPETCECLGDEDCTDAFTDLTACEKARCSACACVREFLDNGETCDDGNECTSGEACVDHACVGGSNVCPCSGDQDCTRYDDDDLCNGSFKCNLTLDVPACEIDAATIVTCTDTLGLFCRTVGCDPATGGCVDVNLHEGEACSDNLACTVSDMCLSGECTGTPDDTLCNDNQPCTDETCEAMTGCVYVANDDQCSDGNACTEGDFCQESVCHSGTDVNCDDQNACTIDSCDNAMGCQNVNAVDLDCDDMDACTTASTCNGGVCVAMAEGCCNDTTDNDSDLLIDCDDPDCVGACPVVGFECTLISPASFTGPSGATFDIRASVAKSGVTDRTSGFDGHPYLRVQYAVAPKDTLMSALPDQAWLTATADAATDDPNSDFWTGTVTVPAITDLSLNRDYMVRVSGDEGATWSYCDIDGTMNGYDYNMAGKITIEAPYQLLFSEYMEGSSNNKAVEVFNASQFKAYLGDCSISVYANGAITPTNTFTLSNIDLEPGDVFTVCHDSLALGGRVFCDMSNTKINHNGDDAIELKCDGVVQDIFGVIGNDPGTNWGTGDTVTVNRTLRRNCQITQGTGAGVTAFDETQWLGLAQDTWQGFGTRLCSGDCVSNETETCCTDGLDTDLDGLTDCADPSCKVTPACFIPVNWCQYDSPAYVRGSVGMGVISLAWVYAAGKTDVTTGNDNPAGVVVQFGFGPDGTMPDANWIWNYAEPAATNMAPRDDADTYRYAHEIPNIPEGLYDLAFRASADGGYSWTLCDLNGSDDGYTLDQAGYGEVVSYPNALFTEYVDGTGNDKAVEIYNVSGRSLDMHNCQITTYADGAVGSSSSFLLEDVLLADNDTYVICQTGVSAGLSTHCDEFRSLLSFNGNDTIVLECETKMMDVIGQRGTDPGAAGWGSGDITTTQHTLRRNCSVIGGDLNDSDAFDPTIQWWGFPVDTFGGLGNILCGTPCYENGGEACCDDANDNDLDGLTDCMDSDCDDADVCQPIVVELGFINQPLSIEFEFGGTSAQVFGEAFLTGVTSNVGQGAGIVAQAGWGPDGSNPDGNVLWNWVAATYYGDLFGSDDQYTATFSDVPVGTFDFAFRFSADAGDHWLYADAEPLGSDDGYSAANAGSMVVTAGTEILCDDAVDNDGDIQVDCNDPDCVMAENCIIPTEELDCDDGIDKDQDGSTDCDDTDCDDDPVCWVAVDWCQMYADSPIISQPGPYIAVKAWVMATGLTDVTDENDNPADVLVDVGLAAAGSDILTWTWQNTSVFPYNEATVNGADSYYRNIQVPNVPVGDYQFAVRASADGGKSWTYCDLDGSDNGFDQANQSGLITVTTAPNVLITEYVEGTADNKAIEITNMSGRQVMLNKCSLTGYLDGAATFAYSMNVNSSGFLADGEILVICDDGADASLAPYCDGLAGLLAFDGNDTIVLECENQVMDVIGQVGFDPGAAGWGSGGLVTVDRTLRRDCGVVLGDGNGSDAFDPTTGWVSFATDNFLDLGIYGCADTCYGNGVEACCADATDNDRDGLADCADADCVDDDACIPDNETACHDTIDEDRDGVSDCADTDCIADATCPVEANCTDGLDDDGDGTIDCADYNCDGNAACPVKVMFSEYGEGASNNKWVEVWNYGTATRDLSGCVITVYSNGASTSTNLTTLTQTAAAANDVWTVCHSSITTTGTICDQKSTYINFNGDDAVVLTCGGTIMDSIGQVGFDPGDRWGTEPLTTLNHTLCRSARTVDVSTTDAFEPSVQWVGYASDNYAGMDVLACP